MTVCVYVAVHGKRAYVGSTHNWDKRLKGHLATLRSGVHHNKYLQNVVNKYGMDAVRWRIVVRFVDGTDDDRLRECEQNVADRFSTKYELMNIATIGRSPTKGRKMPAEGRAKCSTARKLEWATGVRTTPWHAFDANFVKKMTAINRLRASTPEFRAHLQLQAEGQRTPERRQAKSESSTLLWATEDFRNKMLAKRRFGEANNKSRKVTNLDTGATFETLTEAAASVGRNPTSVHEAIARKGRCGGSRWVYAGEDEYVPIDSTPKGATHHCARSVLCVETGEVFGSVVDAVAWVRGTTGRETACSTGIIGCASGNPRNRTAYGLTWKYVGPEPSVAKGRRKTVLRVEDGVVFPSLTAAAESLSQTTGRKCSERCIGNACRATNSCYGSHWRYATEEEKSAYSKNNA